MKFTLRDPKVEVGEDILVQIARHFPKVNNDAFYEAINHMLRMLRTYQPGKAMTTLRNRLLGPTMLTTLRDRPTK